MSIRKQCTLLTVNRSSLYYRPKGELPENLKIMQIMDIYSRKILGWSISISLEAKWCVEVLEDAVRRHRKPDIVNSDQGSQFTSALWTHTLEDLKINI